jgi:hypothetical protein
MPGGAVMRIAAVLLVAALSIPCAALAHDTVVGGCRIERPARLAERHVHDQRFAIHTTDRGATLLLTSRVVAVQLSDRVLRRIDREFDRERDEDDDGALGTVIKDAVLGSVRAMLDHSIECPLRHVRDVRWRDGKLAIVTDRGDRLFEGLVVNDEEMLASFSDRDAIAFVEEFHRTQRSTGR